MARGLPVFAVFGTVVGAFLVIALAILLRLVIAGAVLTVVALVAWFFLSLIGVVPPVPL